MIRTLFIVFSSILFVGCVKKSKTPAQMIEGKWRITSQELLASVTPGDGSYLEFNGCSTNCTGSDFKASDGTLGSFQYILDESGSQLIIIDNSTAGGSYNGTWDVLELNDDIFRMTTSTSFGNLKIEMNKE